MMKERKFRYSSAESTQPKRVLRDQNAAIANYDRLSPWYDLVTSSEKAYTNSGLELLNPQPGERILEIGCGTGDALLNLCSGVGISGFVTGLDISPGMLLTAARKLGKAPVRSYALLRGDGCYLPFADQSYSAVFISFTLELFDTPDIPKVLLEAKRVLVTGGRLCLIALSREGQGFAGQIYEYLHDRCPVLLDCRPIYPTKSLHEVGYSIKARQFRNMWGLQVEIVLAERL